MSIIKLTPRMQPEVGLHGKPAPPRLHSTEELEHILYRERSRADRAGETFSLVAFFARNKVTADASVAHLAKILARRLRITDEVGWVDDQCIGAVLPDTPASGAWNVVDDVCASFPARLARPECTVYCYPSDWWLGEDVRAEDGRQAPEDARPVRAMESLFMQRTPLWKRSLDIIGATVGSILLLPLFLVMAVAIKATSPGPVFFKQVRGGRGGKRFVLIKFRSMVLDADTMKEELLPLSQQDGPAFRLTEDPRVTVLGRFLRLSSIDELPQLWNVLKGEMSLVGPRPLRCAESEACTGWERRRLDVTPGLTCIWQVKGRARVSFAEWMRMDLQYGRSRSLWQDLKLLLQTVPVVLLGRGAT